MAAQLTVLAAAALFSGIAQIYSGTTSFVPGACERLEPFLLDRIVGQDLAIRQLVDAVCAHLANPHPSKPLVISCHGPPGVGKTYTHTLLARVLYNRKPEGAERCPGKDCMGSKVVYGLDFTREDRTSQLQAVRDAIFSHIRQVTDPLIVLEEYDKLDCESRGLVRQLLQHPELSNGTFNKGIVLLQSNLGFQQLGALLQSVGDREKVTPEQAENFIKDLVFEKWLTSKCEAYEDTVRTTSLVDFYLPYFPLERKHLSRLMVLELNRLGQILFKEKGATLGFGEDVAQWLANKIEFEGRFPIEGATHVTNIATRYVSRLVRLCPDCRRGPAPRCKQMELHVDLEGDKLVHVIL